MPYSSDSSSSSSSSSIIGVSDMRVSRQQHTHVALLRQVDSQPASIVTMTTSPPASAAGSRGRPANRLPDVTVGRNKSVE